MVTHPKLIRLPPKKKLKKLKKSSRVTTEIQVILFLIKKVDLLDQSASYVHIIELLNEDEWVLHIYFLFALAKCRYETHN
jgi:hypothetical protein